MRINPFSVKCEYTKKCPFYDRITCDEYYNGIWVCGIKIEKDIGDSWRDITLRHHRQEEAKKDEC